MQAVNQKDPQTGGHLTHSNAILKISNSSFLANSQLSLKLPQLLTKAHIRLAARPLRLYQFQTIVETPFVLLHEIGDEYC